MNVATTIPLSAATALRGDLSLDGTWEFRHESDAAWREAPVPAPWQVLPGLHWSFGRATYRRRFALPQGWRDREVALHFGAVSEVATVRVNGREIGRHEGGYLPFELVIPPDLLEEDNLLEVEAVLPDAHDHEPGLNFAEVPHGKQSWYGPQGGIWQSVRLVARHATHIRALRLDPHWPDGRLEMRLTLSQAVQGMVAIEVLDSSGHALHSETLHLDADRLTHAVTLPRVEPWSPDSPALYTFRATLRAGDEALDSCEERFGFRRFEARDGIFYLNDQPLYMRGALDQDYYPDGFGTPPSLELLEDQVRKAKAMGLNLLRCHIKVPDPRYYEVADRLGMLIWTEIPNVETFTPSSAPRLRATMEGILARDRNHPSIVIWTLINEDWGTRLREVGEQRRWLVDLFDWLKAEDPLRLVVDNSACFPNYHVKTDINDFHYYRTALDRREEWEALSREFAGAADWTFSHQPEAEWTKKEPLVVSEFGVWGLPDPANLKEDGKEPWWMPYGATWAVGVALPTGIEARFHELGLDQVFGSFTQFIEKVQWHQFMNLKYEIEDIRSHAPIAGYVVTEFTDVHWEGNGLMDMARNPRVFAKALSHVNADVVIAPGLRHHAARSGQEIHLDLKVATGGETLPDGARLEWRLNGENGTVALPMTAPMEVTGATLALHTPRVERAEMAALEFRLLAPDGRLISENREALALYPERAAPARQVRFRTDRPLVGERLLVLGHREVEAEDAELFVTDTLDGPRVEAIHAGAHYLQIVEHGQRRLRDDTSPRDGPMTVQIEDAPGGTRSEPYFSFPGYALQNRHNTIWRGDWVGNFPWLRRDGVFAHLPGGPLLDLSFSRVIPHQVLTHQRSWEFRGRVHAGTVVGWVHRPAAFVIEKRLGRGKLVISTFRLMRDAFDADPTATALWDGLIDLALRP
ncbi:glycoside hydrolase family 2 protein [Rubellimicrobium roseum]|uniref:Glycoside hydrolase family 2 n=1 Tax=Rubellimicrobium roseum TaxID=687525 RepID=A0A5C4N5P8_9RHOB|nr:glycoside hydrolase family 2 TIM barrel-domain containing protein [Rubellimicrobium roseum]TNC65023.1 glycoside hydrolase family 2 [Rubellimicrobium roseum]